MFEDEGRHCPVRMALEGIESTCLLGHGWEDPKGVISMGPLTPCRSCLTPSPLAMGALDPDCLLGVGRGSVG